CSPKPSVWGVMRTRLLSTGTELPTSARDRRDAYPTLAQSDYGCGPPGPGVASRLASVEERIFTVCPGVRPAAGLRITRSLVDNPCVISSEVPRSAPILTFFNATLLSGPTVATEGPSFPKIKVFAGINIDRLSPPVLR